MKSIFKEIKKIAITILIMYLLIFIITAICGAFSLSILFGMIYGFVFSILYYILLGSVVEKALSMTEEKQAKRYIKVNYIFRFILLIVILAIPFSTPKINEWCLVAALLAPKITYFLIGFCNMLFKRGEE